MRHLGRTRPGRHLRLPEIIPPNPSRKEWSGVGAGKRIELLKGLEMVRMDARIEASRHHWMADQTKPGDKPGDKTR